MEENKTQALQKLIEFEDTFTTICNDIEYRFDEFQSEMTNALQEFYDDIEEFQDKNESLFTDLGKQWFSKLIEAVDKTKSSVEYMSVDTDSWMVSIPTGDLINAMVKLMVVINVNTTVADALEDVHYALKDKPSFDLLEIDVEEEL